MYVGSLGPLPPFLTVLSDNPSPTWMTSQSKVNSSSICGYNKKFVGLLHGHQITLLVGWAQSHEVLAQGEATYCGWREPTTGLGCRPRWKEKGNDGSDLLRTTISATDLAGAGQVLGSLRPLAGASNTNHWAGSICWAPMFSPPAGSALTSWLVSEVLQVWPYPVFSLITWGLGQLYIKGLCKQWSSL